MKLGYSTWGMPNVPVDDAIRHVAELGFDGIELAVIPGYTTALSTLDRAERQRIAQLLRDHKLALPALSAHASLLEPDPEKYAQNRARLQESMDLAVDWAQDGQPPCVGTTVGGKPEEWATVKPRLLERAADLAEYAGARGVLLTIEPHVGHAIDTPQRMLEFLDALDSPHIKVNFDISHFNIRGIPIAESVAALVPHAANTHVKDERGQVPDFEFVILGEGEFDFVTYVKAMQAHGYTGFITAEISMMVQRRPDYDPMAAAAQSYTTLANAFAAAGIART